METSLSIWGKPDQLSEIKKVYGECLTDIEWNIFLHTGKATGLNPFLREIWAVKYGNAPASIFIGRDGYRKSGSQQPDYKAHLVEAVYRNDTFTVETDTQSGHVLHRVNHVRSNQDRGELIGSYCLVFKKSTDIPNFIQCKFSEYYRGIKKPDGTLKKVWDNGKKQYRDMNPTNWDIMPETMIKKVAEAQTLRQAFPSVFAGTYDESEMVIPEEEYHIADISPAQINAIQTLCKSNTINDEFLKDNNIENISCLFSGNKSRDIKLTYDEATQIIKNLQKYSSKVETVEVKKDEKSNTESIKKPENTVKTESKLEIKTENKTEENDDKQIQLFELQEALKDTPEYDPEYQKIKEAITKLQTN